MPGELPTLARPKIRPVHRVTIADVAERLGLTKGTVSRALNGYTDIAEGTRLRVAKTAEAMGYRPLSHAQAIRTGQTRALGLVLQIDEHDAHGPFLTDFLAGVTRAASAVGWTLTVATAASDQDMIETLGRLVAERKADGFILPRTRIDDPRVAFLRTAGVPCILFGRTGHGRAVPDDISWFDILGETAMHDAVMRLAGFGHRRIGFVGGGRQYNYSPLRLEGFRAGMRDAGLDVDPGLIREDARLAGDGEVATRALLADPLPPTAIVYATDEAALGAYRAAQSSGIEIGRDLSIIAYDGIPAGAYAQPPLTTFSVDTRGAGERLAALLIRQIRGEAPGTLRELAKASLVQRGSDGPPSRTSEELAAHLGS